MSFNPKLSDLCEQVMAVNAWRSLDKPLSKNGMHIVCFKTAAHNDDHKKIARAVVEEMDRDLQLEGEFGKTGFVVFEERQPGLYDREYCLTEKNAKQIVGVIAADPFILQKQYEYAKTVLSALGLCEIVSRQLFLRDGYDVFVRTEEKESHSKSRIFSSKNAAESGFPFLKSEISASDERSRTASFEAKTENSIGVGAVRSAALINMIAHHFNVNNLSSLEKVDSGIVLDLSVGTDQAKERLVHQAAQLDQDCATVNENIVKVCATLHDRLEERHDARRLTVSESAALHRILDGLAVVANDFHHNNVNSSTFENLSALSSQAGHSVFDDWLRNGISYCMHGGILSHCIAHAHTKTCDAIEKFDASATPSSDNLPSASLGFWAKIERLPAPEAVKKGVRPT